MTESKTWTKFKEIAQKIDHGMVIVTIRAGCPQTFAPIGEKQLILPPPLEAQPLPSSDANNIGGYDNARRGNKTRKGAVT